MRSNEERVAAVKSRVKEIERQKRQRMSRIITVSSMAACFIVIVVLSGLMPDIIHRIDAGKIQKYNVTASMFGNSATSGYIAIALIAFLLGICVTIFCTRMHHYMQMEQQEQGNPEEKDG